MEEQQEIFGGENVGTFQNGQVALWIVDTD